MNISLGYIGILNVFLFCAMYVDKRRAQKHKWRIPERTLLFLGIIGGGLGGLLAQRIFHHKTRKIQFSLFFILGIIIDGAIVYYSYK